MRGTSNHTDEQKATFVTLAQSKGRKAAAKKAKVTPTTISHWAKALGVTLTGPTKKTRRKRKVASSNGAAAPVNGKGNGHAPSAAGELAALHVQLESALGSVKKMRDAFREVFG